MNTFGYLIINLFISSIIAFLIYQYFLYTQKKEKKRWYYDKI